MNRAARAIMTPFISIHSKTKYFHINLINLAKAGKKL